MVVTKMLKYVCFSLGLPVVDDGVGASSGLKFRTLGCIFRSSFICKLLIMPVAPERITFVFQRVERDLVKLSSKQTVASVHSFRTGARRLQILCEQLLPERDRNQKKLLKLLSRMRKRAGKIRDLDAQLAALRSLKVLQQPRRKTQLMQALIELRAENEKRLRKALTKEAVREVRKRLRRARKDLQPKEIHDPLEVAREMLSQTANPKGSLTEEVLHQQRIVTKHARYVAEFAPKSPEADRLIAQLKHAQDALGDWHDWLMLTQTSVQHLGDVHQSPLVALLHNLTGAKFRKAVSTLAAARPAHANAKPAAARKAEMSANQASPDTSSITTIAATSAA
jgi:CHAD domain-containing protein